MRRFFRNGGPIGHYRHIGVPAVIAHSRPLDKYLVAAPKHVVNRFFRTCSISHAYNPSNVPNPGYLLNRSLNGLYNRSSSLIDNHSLMDIMHSFTHSISYITAGCWSYNE